MKHKGYELVRRIKTALALIVPTVFVVVLGGFFAHYFDGRNISVLHPAGAIGEAERNLIDLAMILSVIVVVPVFALTIFIALRYRETNPKPTKYKPEWDGSRALEAVWWGIPGIIIIILSVVTWVSSHDLDPYKSLASDVKPLRVQVVSMDWKWLFIYPDQHMASVNELYVPINTPVSFEITSNTVMNSFWIPSLGSQIYAMPGMSTKLHLIAEKSGKYYGSPANITGKGFASMTFDVHATSQKVFDRWVHATQIKNRNLTMARFEKLAKPSQNHSVEYFSPVQDNLYDEVVMKYMDGHGGVGSIPLYQHEHGGSN